MNILSVVNLPSTVWQCVVDAYPDIEVRTELDPTQLDGLTDWPEVVFGNVSPEWALRASRAGMLRWLQSVSAGVEAYQGLAETAVRLTSSRGVHHQPIAEHLLMMILALTRNLPSHLRNQQGERWRRQPDSIIPVEGKQLGIVGFGGIGQRLVSLVKPLGMRAAGTSASVTTVEIRDGAEIWPMSRLNELIETSDHLVLCLPLTTETKGLINENRFGSMKQGSYFYNIARGQLVDEAALLHALQSGHLAGAALDVFQNEPLPMGHPFWTLPNMIITPHIAGHYRGLRETTFELFRKNLDFYRRGVALRNEVQFRGTSLKWLK